jgi:hypothetical protein
MWWKLRTLDNNTISHELIQSSTLVSCVHDTNAYSQTKTIPLVYCGIQFVAKL